MVVRVQKILVERLNINHLPFYIISENRAAPTEVIEKEVSKVVHTDG